MLEDCLFASSLFSIFGGIAKVKAIENIRNGSLNFIANQLFVERCITQRLTRAFLQNPHLKFQNSRYIEREIFHAVKVQTRMQINENT